MKPSILNMKQHFKTGVTNLSLDIHLPFRKWINHHLHLKDQQSPIVQFLQERENQYQQFVSNEIIR